MKKFLALILLAFFILSMSACVYPESTDVSEKYIVLESTDTYLLVALIGEDGNTIEMMQYSVPNLFYPSINIKAGDVITINHNGVALETYPMQFGQIYSMEYRDRETGHTTTVSPD